MIERMVIADDFTGALDTGVQFAQQGIETLVALSRAFDPALYGQDARVVCLDAETRHLKPEEAYQVVYALAKQALAAGTTAILKKVDSTLRGQIGSELAAVMDAAEDSLSFVPAFPAAGRTTVDGVHRLDGAPIHETVFGRDPFEPILCSDIRGIIRAQRPLDVVYVPVGKAPPPHQGKRVEVFDAQTDRDVAQAAQIIADSGRRLMAGCAGLARALAQQMAGGRPVGSPQQKEGMLAVCGSLNPISDRQVAWAQAHGFLCMEIPLGFMEEGTGLNAFLDKACRAGAMGVKVILLAPRAKELADAQVAQSRKKTAERIGQVIEGWYMRGLDHTLVVTGGDTLHAFLERLGPQVVLRPQCELQPGVALSKMCDQGSGRVLQIISKAGGFGTQSVYEDIAGQVLLSSDRAREEGGHRR